MKESSRIKGRCLRDFGWLRKGGAERVAAGLYNLLTVARKESIRTSRLAVKGIQIDENPFRGQSPEQLQDGDNLVFPAGASGNRQMRVIIRVQLEWGPISRKIRTPSAYAW